MASPPEVDMDNTPKISSTGWIKYAVAGFLLGILIVSLSAAGLFAVQIANPPPTATLLPTPTVAVRALLDAAREALYTNGDSQRAIDTLSPHLDEFTNPDELMEALQYLSMAEMGQGHYQMAAAYLERIVQIDPSPENYATLARLYDSAGDLEHALANYLIYLDSNDPNLTPDLRQMVRERVNQIQSILTSFTPTPKP
jgi:tetratricopeptide (TPR) repeat protein